MELKGCQGTKSIAVGSLVDMDGAKSRDLTLMTHMGKRQQLNVRTLQLQASRDNDRS